MKAFPIAFFLLCTLYLLRISMSIASTPFCDGWDDASMSVERCSIPGIENFANKGYGILFISAFTLGVPLVLIMLGLGAVLGYWFNKLSAKNLRTEKPIQYWISNAGIVMSNVSIALLLLALTLFITQP